MAIAIDRSAFPFLVVTGRGAHTDAEFEEYLEEFTSIVETCRSDGRRYALIVDGTDGVSPRSKQTRMQAQWLKDHLEAIRIVNVGTVFIMPSPVVRGVVKAILWLQPLPTEHAVVSTMAQAEAWARKRLEAEGVPIPEGLQLSRRLDPAGS